ncbi:MAG: flagellar motor switch protein FliG [Gammaproteobacteria bacterium]|jgi:flagellar motor switch protein FliG
MADQAKSLDGASRAAILLLTLGEQSAAQVLQHMGPKEVQRLGSAMATTKNISQRQVNDVLREFLELAGQHTALGIDSETYVRSVLVKALGEDRANGLMERILLGGSTHGLDTLKWMEPRAVAEMIRNEHPQIMAIVLSYLDSDHAAAILSQLPQRVRTDVVIRIATVDVVQPAALQTLNEMLEKQVSGTSSVHTSSVGGPKIAADILNFADSTLEGEILDQLKELDAELGQQIQDLMFVFDNLRELDDKGMQTVLREVSSESLLLALKGTDNALKEKVFKNMSKRAGEMLREDLEAKGPVRVSEVEAAQKEILSIARRLADEGQLSLGLKGSEELI